MDPTRLLTWFGRVVILEWFLLPQSDKLQEQQDLIEELQCHLSTPALLGLGLNLNLRSRPHTAPMGSLQHGQNGGCSRQVRIQQSRSRLGLGSTGLQGFALMLRFSLSVDVDLGMCAVPARYV